MKCRGEIVGLSLNWRSKKPEVTLALDANAEDLERLQEKQLSVEIKQYRKKRSLEANSYHWVLCTQIAKVIGQTVAYVHNTLLRECGYIETMEGNAMMIPLPDTEEVARATLEASTYHLFPTSQVIAGTDGVAYRTYKLLRGSHDFDSAEMAHLIDRTIDMAKELGIETLTENQRLEMMAAYEQYRK